MSVDFETVATRQAIELERERLAAAVGRLRTQVGRARRQPLEPGVATVLGVAVCGFVLAGGVHATMRLLGVRERRKRERALPGLLQ
jgi:hypothetical protein